MTAKKRSGHEALSIVDASCDAPPYRLVRVRRRTIGLVVDDAGLTIRAPLRATRADIASALTDKRDWITTQLALWQRRAERRVRQDWRDLRGRSACRSAHPLDFHSGMSERNPLTRASARKRQSDCVANKN